MTGCRSPENELFLPDTSCQAQGEEENEPLSASVPKVVSETAGHDRSFQDEALAEDLLPDTIFVDVEGAVCSPGVYKLEAGSRVFQAIDAAGGFRADAVPSRINQALPLADSSQIYVPTRSEEEDRLNVQTDPSSHKTDPSDGSMSLDSGFAKININTAGLSELSSLNGIGSVRAQAIIDYRNLCGLFLSVEDIMKVPGIKEGTFAKIQDKITI